MGWQWHQLDHICKSFAPSFSRITMPACHDIFFTIILYTSAYNNIVVYLNFEMCNEVNKYCILSLCSRQCFVLIFLYSTYVTVVVNFYYLAPRGRSIAISMSLGLHISKTMCKLHKICLYKLHVTLGPSLTTMQYVISELERVAICYRPSACM